MKIIRLGGLTLIAIFAMALASASSALPVPPLFSSGSIGATFKAIGLPTTAKFGANVIFCDKNASEGAITSVHLMGPFFIHFLECKSSGNNGASYCEINSQGASSGLILTKTLHALLGLALPSQLPALLFLPTSGKQWLLLEKNECTPETFITGTLAALISNQRKVPALATLLTFRPGDITLIHTLLGLIEPALSIFTTTANLETAAHLTWSKDIEIV